MVVALDTLLSSKAMASGHLIRPECSAATKHIGVSDVLLLVPMKFSDVPSSGGWSASMSLLRSSATMRTGIVLPGLICNFYFFRGCLCKMWDVCKLS
jgi:hypothetical protein